jgi:hypothetical protein
MKMIDDNNLMEKEVVQEDPLSIDDTRGEEASGKTLDDDAGANENDLQSLVEDSSDDDGYAADEEPDMPDKVPPMLKRSKGRWHSGRNRAENGWLSSRDVAIKDDAEARDDALEADGLSIINSALELAAAVAKGKEADQRKEEEYESHRKHPHDDSDEHLADDDGSELELVPTNQQRPPFSIRSVDDTMLQLGEFIAQSVLDDFLKVALNDEVTGLHQIKTIQTDFCTLLTRRGWTACHQRYFHSKTKVKKYRFERKPALDCPILIVPIFIPGHYASVVRERKSNGETIFRYIDSIKSDQRSEYLQQLFYDTEFWNHEEGKTVWQQVPSPQQSTLGMDCLVWVCSTVLKYLLIRKDNVDVFQEKTTELSITCRIDAGDFGIQARKMVWDTLQEEKLPPLNELTISNLIISNRTQVLST